MSSTTGSYVLSWGASSGVVSQYTLYENGTGIYNGGAQALSASIGGRINGTYRYKVQACNSAGCSAFTAELAVTVLLPPGMPGDITLATESGPSYTVAWGAASGVVDHYDLDESFNSGSSATIQVVGTSKSYTGKPYGKYSYRVRACNASGCSAYPASKTVDVITALSAFADSTVPSLVVPPQEWVGTIPGSAGVEGGAATYRIPIEIPPGRGGMQPDVSLAYNSRSGNGVAGVGWVVTAASTIYRCPRTLAQEGANRTVQHNAADRLCFDGQRLVGDLNYGNSGSVYRTEIDQFDRVTLLNGDTGSWGSYFQVEHKSGRISQFEPVATSGSSGVPDVWYKVREFDRQGNCVRYAYTTFSVRGTDQELVLSAISYTDKRGTDGRTCVSGTLPGEVQRKVEFSYTSDREDKRTTYRFGVATPFTARLAAILTKVGDQYVRRYELSYKVSGATRRSLLASITLCRPADAAGGSSCAVEQLPPTLFEYQEDGLASAFDMWHVQKNGQPLGPTAQVPMVGDFDGDGTRDHYYVEGTSKTLELTCGAQSLVSGPWWIGFDQPIDTSMRGADSYDMDNDGRTDVIGVIGGFLSYGTVTCNGSNLNWTTKQTMLPLNASTSGPGAFGVDYDGDGLIDLRYWDPSAGSKENIYLERSRQLDWSSYTRIDGPTLTSNMIPTVTRDINGDGMIDTVFDDSRNLMTADSTQVKFLQANLTFSAAYRLDQLGGPPNTSPPSQGLKWRRWIDVNGDGLVDVYEPGFIWINRGGFVGGTSMFQRVAVTLAPGVPALDPKRTSRAFVMDVDSDGVEELMVPTNRDGHYEFCAGGPVGPGGEPSTYCGSEFDSAPSAYQDIDESVFIWDAYKFREKSDGSYEMVLVHTNLEAPINHGLLQRDSNGDGTIDLGYSIHGANYPGLAIADQGPYISRNFTRAPDLLLSVKHSLYQGRDIGASASWQHQPLSRKSVAGCDLPGGESFYVAHHDWQRSAGYAYFTSSMWTVSRLDVSNGLGVATNRTCFRYQDAMLNMEGRGFQGFKVIVAEEQMAPAAGEQTSSTAGCGGTCSLNNRRTTTEFFQEFPLAGRLSKATVAQMAATGAKTLSETTYWWDVQGHQAFPGAYVVSGTGTVDRNYETSGALVSRKATIREIDQLSGEPSRLCAMSSGQALDVSRDVLVQDTRTLQDDTSIWWLGKLLSRQVVTDFGGGMALDGTCQLSGSHLPSWSCSRVTPFCPAVSPTTSAKTQTTNYFWNAGDTAGSSRKLEHQDLVLTQGATETSTAFRYDTFGNVNWKQVTARDIASDAAYPPTNTGPVTLPATTYEFSSDNYFVTVETNPLGHKATTVRDSATGLPTYHQTVQGGPSTRITYDALGRLVTISLDGQQNVEQRLLGCGSGTGDCVIKRQTFQAGAPVKTEYLDVLGRTIATGIEGFDSKEVVTKIDYNARGAKIAEHAPITTGAAPGAWNGTLASSFATQYSGIDVLGRAATKTVVRSSTPDLFDTGRGSANLVTTYSYTAVSLGIQTAITVSTPTTTAGNITMSRTYDPRGKLVQTVQHVSTPTAHDITTTYSYDPTGNLTVITDPANYPLKAIYDALGRKIEVDDPDRGKWFYTWDGLGRVRNQKDARGITLAYQYDAIGRMERRFMQPQAGGTWLLEANWQYDLNGKLGTLGAVLGVGDTIQGTLTDQSRDWFHRDYKYDALLRPWSIATHIPAGTESGVSTWTAQDLTIEYGYDHNYGRPKAMSSPTPNQEFVRFDYDTHGSSIGETPLGSAGNPTGPAYRHVNSMSVRGQISDQLFGNNVDESTQYDDSTGIALWTTATGLHEPSTSCPNAATPLVRQLIYKYDHFLNLARQEKDLYKRDASGALLFNSCSPITAAVTETYQYDELQRLTQTSRSWVNVTPDSSAATPTGYGYSDTGNVTSKSDYANVYTYPTPPPSSYTAPGPHAVISLSNGMTFTYDANGNMKGSTGLDARTVTFDNLDRPIRVVKGSAITIFRYAPDGSRYLQSTTVPGTNPYPKTVYYVDKLFERLVWNGATEEKTYIGPAVVIYRNGTNREVRYLHVDRLGSVEAVTVSTAAEYFLDRHAFDAFGQPRNADFTTSGGRLHSSDYNVTTERGFTGHEHLDDTYLIHMNGRVYDYKLGRFLSVDPIISNPANSQSINPYSYVGNNPLSGVDPTGYAASCTMLTGSHACDAGFAGDNLSINGVPGVGGSFKAPAASSSGATSGAASSTSPTPGTNASAPVDHGSPSQVAQKTAEPSTVPTAPSKLPDSQRTAEPRSVPTAPGTLLDSNGQSGFSSTRRVAERGYEEQIEVTAPRAWRRTEYTAWSVSFGLPWWRGWGFTYGESHVGSRNVAFVGFGWGRTVTLLNTFGYSYTSGSILMNPRGSPIVPLDDHPTMSAPLAPPGLTEAQIARQLAGFSVQGFASAGVGGIANISLGTPPPGSSGLSTEKGFLNPGIGVQLNFGWEY